MSARIGTGKTRNKGWAFGAVDGQTHKPLAIIQKASRLLFPIGKIQAAASCDIWTMPTRPPTRITGYLQKADPRRLRLELSRQYRRQMLIEEELVHRSSELHSVEENKLSGIEKLHLEESRRLKEREETQKQEQVERERIQESIKECNQKASEAKKARKTARQRERRASQKKMKLARKMEERAPEVAPSAAITSSEETRTAKELCLAVQVPRSVN